MGEAKRRAELGPTRMVMVTRQELTELTYHLLRVGEDGKPRTSDRKERKALKRALRQTGAIKIWELLVEKGTVPAEDMKQAVPEKQVVEITVETVDWLLTALGEVTVSGGLVLVDLEEKLEDAKAGINLVEAPEEVVRAPAEPDLAQ